MSLFESIISVVVVGIMVTILSFIPTGIMQNEHEAEQLLTFSKAMDAFSYEAEQVDWATVTDIDLKISEMLTEIKTEMNEEIGSRFTMEGEIVEIETKKFVKVSVSTNKIEQEYFYGFKEFE